MPEALISAYLMERCGVPFCHENIRAMCRLEEGEFISDAINEAFSLRAEAMPEDLGALIDREPDIFAWPWERLDAQALLLAPRDAGSSIYKLARELQKVLAEPSIEYRRAVELHYKILDKTVYGR